MASQKEDMKIVFKDFKKVGVLDYVTAWYKKALDYSEGTTIKVGFVSTSSIIQGEQVSALWKQLKEKYTFYINFAHQPFKWTNEARNNAAVTVVIIGFSATETKNKILFKYSNSEKQQGMDIVPEAIKVNQGLIILIATFLWLTTLLISIFFVMRYAAKVKADKGSTFLSLREQTAAEKKFGSFGNKLDKEVKLSKKQKVTLILFALTFVVMIVGFIPWGEFGITLFDKFTGWLTGASLGNWWFYEAALWFLLMSIVIGIINGMGEDGIVDAFVDGADDMVGVVLVIAVARGASVLMGVTHLDNYIIYNAADFLSKLPEVVFVPLNYLLHVVLSILVPSSSGLATLSTPIIGPLSAQLGYNPEVSIMSMVAANGLVNLITPTCGAIMGGLALAKVEYSTWFRWALKIVITIAIVNILVLSIFAIIL